MTRLCLAFGFFVLPGCADLTAPSPYSGAARTDTAAAAAPAPAPAPAPVPGERPAENKDALVKVRASHVLVAYEGARRSSAKRTKDEAKKLAEQLLTRVRGGAKFEDIATEHSDDPSAKTRGGDLGAFDRFTMTKAFADAAFALNVGQISEVVETEFGFHIIKRTE